MVATATEPCEAVGAVWLINTVCVPYVLMLFGRVALSAACTRVVINWVILLGLWFRLEGQTGC